MSVVYNNRGRRDRDNICRVVAFITSYVINVYHHSVVAVSWYYSFINETYRTHRYNCTFVFSKVTRHTNEHNLLPYAWSRNLCTCFRHSCHRKLFQKKPKSPSRNVVGLSSNCFHINLYSFTGRRYKQYSTL